MRSPEWLKMLVIGNLFGNNINIYIISKILEVPEGDDPGEYFFKMAEKQEVTFEISLSGENQVKLICSAADMLKRYKELDEDETGVEAWGLAYMMTTLKKKVDVINDPNGESKDLYYLSNYTVVGDVLTARLLYAPQQFDPGRVGKDLMKKFFLEDTPGLMAFCHANGLAFSVKWYPTQDLSAGLSSVVDKTPVSYDYSKAEVQKSWKAFIDHLDEYVDKNADDGVD